MKCEICGKNWKPKKERRLIPFGEGLTNVYLDNSLFEICRYCGNERHGFETLGKLLDVIAEAIALQDGSLDGASMKFLRKNAAVKASKWANIMGVDPSTLSRWENNAQTIGVQSDKLARTIYFHMKSDTANLTIQKKLGVVIRRSLSINNTGQNIIIDAKSFKYRYIKCIDKAA